MARELDQAVRETRRLENQARVTRRALRALQDELGAEHVLGVYNLAPGERITDEVLDLLALAVGSTDQRVKVTITAPDGGTDKGAQHGP